MLTTRLRRSDRASDGEPKIWSIRAMMFFAHRLRVEVTLRREDQTVLEFDRLVTEDEFITVMSWEKFAELRCTVECNDDREKGDGF